MNIWKKNNTIHPSCFPVLHKNRHLNSIRLSLPDVSFSSAVFSRLKWCVQTWKTVVKNINEGHQTIVIAEISYKYIKHSLPTLDLLPSMSSDIVQWLHFDLLHLFYFSWPWFLVLIGLPAPFNWSPFPPTAFLFFLFPRTSHQKS